ncbi:MAG TPA: exodeoxyribonuclease VII small subunit [bacterium]|nr:exodeoxyribonuclease VII small subunit [bacterium]
MSEPKFEDALNKLEKIVEEMAAGDVTLDESLKKYEEGIKLSRFCLKKLEDAEKKIEILQKGTDGKVTRKKFSPRDTGAAAGERQQAIGDETGGELPF